MTAFENLTKQGFGGELMLVNRRGGIVHGRPSVENAARLGRPVDLGIVMVPGGAVREAIQDLAEAGGRAAVILTSGFAEMGAAGAAEQEAVAAEAARHDVRLLGPNCLGFMNFVDRIHAWTTPVRDAGRRGRVAIVSQSGATALFLANLAGQQGVDLTYVVSTGNEADLDAATIIDFLVDDPATHAIAAFLETIRDPATFLRAAERAIAAGKPIVCLKVGASEVTAKSAQAHTGALVGDDRVFDGICRQFGLIRVHSVEELLATADIASRTGVLRPGGIAILSNSGGICEIAADTADRHGLALPEPSAAATARLRAVLPDYGTPHNPLDATGGVEPAGCEEAVLAFASEPQVAAILAAWYEIPTSSDQMSERLTALHHHLSTGLNQAPVPGLLVSYTNAVVNDFARDLVAEYQAPYVACGLDRALAGLGAIALWSERQRSWRSHGSAGADAPATERPRSEATALAYLAASGVPVVPATLARSEAEAVAAAARLGCPAVLKIASPEIAHKSDIGGVALNVAGDDAVATAYRRITEAARRHAPDASIEGVLVAPMREGGIELFVGVTRDPQWGAVLALGLGGIWVETLKDVALCLLPADAAEIRRALVGLRGAKLLAGQRGVPPADLDAVSGVIERIGAAASRLGTDLDAFEVNPLWVRGGEVEALDALATWADPGGA